MYKNDYKQALIGIAVLGMAAWGAAGQPTSDSSELFRTQRGAPLVLNKTVDVQSEQNFFESARDIKELAKFIELEKMPKPSNISMLTSKTVLAMQLVARKEIDKDATNVQRAELYRDKSIEMLNLLNTTIDQPVTATIEIIDIVERPQPETDTPEYQVWLHTKYQIVGSLKWQAPMVLSDADKAKLAETKERYANQINALKKRYSDEKSIVRDKAAKEREGVRNSYNNNEQRKARNDALKAVGDRMEGELKRIDDKMKAEVGRLEDKMDTEYDPMVKSAKKKVPLHYVTVLTNSEDVLKWKRGQKQTLTGYVHATRASVYNTLSSEAFKPFGERGEAFQERMAQSNNMSLEAAYVGLEYVVHARPGMPKNMVVEDDAELVGSKETAEAEKEPKEAGPAAP